MAPFQAIRVYLRREIDVGCSFAGIGMADVALGRRTVAVAAITVSEKMRNSSKFNESI